jgi:hypothetical protein
MCDIYDFQHVTHNIQLLRQQHQCDLVIVTHHGGAEGVAATRVTRQDEFFGGGRRGNVYNFSHHCIDAGADLVFGHGPHVVRGIELYKGKLIAYSLGNFCTPYSVYIKGICGYAPILLVTLTTQGDFCGGKIVSARQIDRTGPKLDSTNIVVKEIQRLSQLDFPETRYGIVTAQYITSSSGGTGVYNTMGIHSRGSGWTPYNEFYRLPEAEPIPVVDEEGNPIEGLFIIEKDSPDLVEKQQAFVDSLLLNENGLEMAFEGPRFYDIMRFAMRQSNPEKFLAEKVAARRGKNNIDEALKSRLMDKRNWYLSWKGQIGL